MHRMTRVWRRFLSVSGRIARWPLRFITMRRIVAGASLLAMVFLSCIAGAAFIYYNFGPAKSLRSAFMGFDSWILRGDLTSIKSKVTRTRLGISCDDPKSTFDGFTLYNTTQGTTAYLIDMRGNRIHQWSRPFSQVWANPPHVKHPLPDDAIHWFRCRASPNGDLLAIYQADTDTPHGYGLAKLDKQSNLLWAYSSNVHHDLDVGDDGKIYTLTHQISTQQLEGLISITPPYLADHVAILSPDGKELDKISILEAIQNSPYALMLASIEAGGIEPPSRPDASAVAPGTIAVPGADALKLMSQSSKESGDVLHANGIRVLKHALAPEFPHFNEGQILLSLCHLNAIAVLDVPSRSIVWLAQGAWRMQHDAEFLRNGHILLFDNLGEPHNSRVIEFDPRTLGYPWSYSNENSTRFASTHRGMKQHLPNGNVLIVDPSDGRLFEVTAGKALVWEFGCRADGENNDASPIITGALRYTRSELKFLEGTPVRP